MGRKPGWRRCVSKPKANACADRQGLLSEATGFEPLRAARCHRMPVGHLIRRETFRKRCPTVLPQVIQLGGYFRCLVCHYLHPGRELVCVNCCGTFICPVYSPWPVPGSSLSARSPDIVEASAPAFSIGPASASHSLLTRAPLSPSLTGVSLPALVQGGDPTHSTSGGADTGLKSHTALLSTALEQRKQSPLVPSLVTLVKWSSRSVIKLPSFV